MPHVETDHPVLYGLGMRLRLVHLLAALLIAVFAIGAPPPAEASCAQCVDCTADAPAKNQAPCPEKGLVCQIATNCASQVQKMPAPAAIVRDAASGKAVFGDAGAIAVKLALVKPETSPPRT